MRRRTVLIGGVVLAVLVILPPLSVWQGCGYHVPEAVVLRIPVMATNAGTTVEAIASVDVSRFAANGQSVGLRYVNVEFGRAGFVSACRRYGICP